MTNERLKENLQLHLKKESYTIGLANVRLAKVRSAMVRSVRVNQHKDH